MNDRIGFEMLLDDVLHEVANSEPMQGLEQRVMRQVETVPAMHAQAYEDDPRQNTLFDTSGSEQGVFGSLWTGLRDLLFQPKLPPLALESRPIAVADRMASGNSYPSTGYAVAVHALVILLIGFVVNAQIRKAPRMLDSVTSVVDPPIALRIPPQTDRIGGGGGQKGVTPVTRGHLPKLVQEQIAAPKVPQFQTAMIAVEPSVVVQPDLKMADSALPNIGVPMAQTVVAGAMGNGRGTGLGSGDGDGIGPGTGGNLGGGLRHVGGGVTPPEVIYQPSPEFSDEARKAKVSGVVHVYLWVNEHGDPTHVRVIRGLGMGLDDKAVESVKQYRFKPATENGKPVTVEMYVDVVFTIS